MSVQGWLIWLSLRQLMSTNCTDMVCCSKDLPIVIFALAISLLLKKDKKANFKNTSPQLMLA